MRREWRRDWQQIKTNEHNNLDIFKSELLLQYLIIRNGLDINIELFEHDDDFIKSRSQDKLKITKKI